MYILNGYLLACPHWRQIVADRGEWATINSFIHTILRFVTVAEQVAAATQQRDLQDSGNSDELRLELTQQLQSTTVTGDVWISYLRHAIRFNKVV